jgi:hypothetical protein
VLFNSSTFINKLHSDSSSCEEFMIEWGLANILSQLIFLDFRSVMKIFMSYVAKYNVDGALPVNM